MTNPIPTQPTENNSTPAVITTPWPVWIVDLNDPANVSALCDIFMYRNMTGRWPPVPAAVPAPVAPPPHVPSPVAVRWVQVKDPTAKVNVRSAPVKVDGNEIGSMTGIMKYAVLGENESWWKISYALKEGWASKTWTRLE